MRGRFDQFTKQVIRAGYTPFGPVETDAEVSPDTRRIDLSFMPYPDLPPRALAHLGLLGEMAETACTIETFHETPHGDEIMTCVCKHHFFRLTLKQRDPARALPVQWIISSGVPLGGIAGLCFEPSVMYGPGVYHGPPLTYTNLIVVSELPETRHTLLVRLMGAGRVFTKAMVELKALPPDAPERVLALPIVVRLRLEVTDPAQRTRDDEEFFMSTQDIVEGWIEQWRTEGLNEGRKEGLKEGLKEGHKEGRREGLVEALLTLYEAHFGTPPPDVVEAIQQPHDPAVLRSWLKLMGSGSADDVIKALRGVEPS